MPLLPNAVFIENRVEPRKLNGISNVEYWGLRVKRVA